MVSRHDLMKVIARTDADVEVHVRKALAELSMRLNSLDVRVSDGMVTLSGPADLSTLRWRRS